MHVFEIAMAVSKLNYLIENFGSREGLEELGWQHVPVLNCPEAKDWREIISCACRKNFGLYVDSTGNSSWFQKPIAVRNANVFNLNVDFVEAVKRCRTEKDVMKIFNKFTEAGKSRLISRLGDKEWAPQSKAWNMRVTDLAEYSVPSNLSRHHSSGIIKLGRWHTDGHVEEGGDDSLSYTPVGLKIFLIANRRKYSQLLLKSTKTMECTVNLILNGPPKGWKENVKIFVSASDLFLAQPALCCHSVLIVSEGPAFVTGWEAMDRNDTKRSRQTLNYFATGLSAKTLRELRKEKSMSQISAIIEKKEEEEAANKRQEEQSESEAAMQLRSQVERGLDVEAPPQKSGVSERGKNNR